MATATLSLDQINYINIGLMAVSAVAAIVLPFEVFLFSYGVLGPLHYLTEISWLYDRKFFAKMKWDWLLLLGLGILHSWVTFGIETKFDWGTAFIFIAFGMGLALTLFENLLYRTMFFIVCLVGISFLHKTDFYTYIFAVYMPTIIHVFVFTGAFILYGSLKSKSTSGHLSLFAFAACALAVILFNADTGYLISGYARQSYGLFDGLNYYLLKTFGVNQVTEETIFSSSVGLSVMRFIAFAYTYHYLNWFSKTSVIQWHQIPLWRMLTIIGLWVASVGIYLYDYKIGFYALFFLSFCHVLLEFPLNHQSFLGIGKELMRMRKK